MFRRGFLAIAQAMTMKLVGHSRLENPSPNWKINTAICLFIPMRSAIGVIIGMDTAACPEPDGTRKFNRVWKISIATPLAYKDRF